MKDRELIARNIINIIDVVNCHKWTIFVNDDMYEQVYEYMMDISKNDDTANQHAKSMMLKNKEIINKIVQGVDIPILEFNELMESFRKYKRKFIL